MFNVTIEPNNFKSARIYEYEGVRYLELKVIMKDNYGTEYELEIPRISLDEFNINTTESKYHGKVVNCISEVQLKAFPCDTDRSHTYTIKKQ